MRIHRLALTNYKGVVRRETTFPDSGVIVLEGPNEIGKTSMIEALDLLLEEKDSATKANVRAMQPVDRDVATEVEAEISTGKYRFTYRKRWFRSPATELTVTAPARENLTGLRAHQRVEQMLAETADMDLFKALRLMQASPLRQDGFRSSTALSDALDRSAGRVDSAGDVGESLIEAAEREFQSYFTARRMEPTGEYREKGARLEALREAVGTARRVLEEVQQDAEAHARTTEELATCEKESQRAQLELESVRALWSAVAELERRAEAAHTATRLAESEYQRASADRDGRAGRVADLAAAETTCAELAVSQASLREDLALAERTLAERRSASDAADSSEREARAAVDRLERDLSHMRAVAELQELESRLREIAAAEDRRSAAHSRLSQLIVDDTIMDRIRAAERALDDAHLEQRAASGTVTFTALADTQVDIDGERRRLAGGDVVDRPLVEALDIVVPGVLRFAFRPEAGAGERAERVASAQAVFAEVLREAGVEDVAQAERLHAERDATERERREAGARYDALLRGERIEDLRDRRRALADATASYLRERPPAPPLPADVEGAEMAVAAARREHDRAREAAEEARRAVEVMRDESERLRQEISGLAGRAEVAERHRVEARDRLATERGDASDDELGQGAAVATANLVTARAKEEELRQRLEEEEPERLQLLLKGSEASVNSWAARREVLRERRAGIGARLELAGGQGLQEQYDAAESELAHASSAYTAIDRRARAAKLLYTSLARHRSEAQQAYVGPFAAAVNHLGRVVYSRDFTVEVDDQLRVVARVLDGRRIPFESLSTGAKEQLAVLTRLACATLVDSEQGVPVVIDDALGYTDPERLLRVCAAIGSADGDVQLILLTCTPGRYMGIPGAEFVTVS